MSHVTKDKKKLLARVNRIAGQVSALKSTIESAEDNNDCHSVMHQIASVRGAINGLMLHYLDEHLRDHVAMGDSPEKRLEEAEEFISALRSFRS